MRMSTFQSLEVGWWVQEHNKSCSGRTHNTLTYTSEATDLGWLLTISCSCGKKKEVLTEYEGEVKSSV
jgi:hypothetical protein